MLSTSFMLVIVLPRLTKLAALLYALLILALMIVVSARGQQVDFRQLTEARGKRVTQAIESYFSRKGRYPQDLHQLIPWTALSLPGPVIIYGEDWCYDAGDRYYRLGYVDRDHWSSPILTGQLFSTKGELPDLPPICDEEITAILRERYPDIYR